MSAMATSDLPDNRKAKAMTRAIGTALAETVKHGVTKRLWHASPLIAHRDARQSLVADAGLHARDQSDFAASMD